MIYGFTKQYLSFRNHFHGLLFSFSPEVIGLLQNDYGIKVAFCTNQLLRQVKHNITFAGSSGEDMLGSKRFVEIRQGIELNFVPCGNFVFMIIIILIINRHIKADRSDWIVEGYAGKLKAIDGDPVFKEIWYDYI